MTAPGRVGQDAVSGREAVLPALAEVFREHGYAGASLNAITAATGLGKGSLYHAFPGGKEDMAAAVLAHVDAWFESEVFAPLRGADRPAEALQAMLAACESYFRSGRRVCLVGAFALADTRDRFAVAVRDYFARWQEAIVGALMRAGCPQVIRDALAEDVVLSIQGAVVLARAYDDPDVFTRATERLRRKLMDAARSLSRPGVPERGG